MATLQYNGVRIRPFTLYFPSELSRHIEPEVSREVELSSEDADWLLANTEPGVWTKVEDAPVEALAEAEESQADEPAPTTRSIKRTRTTAAEDGKS